MYRSHYPGYLALVNSELVFSFIHYSNAMIFHILNFQFSMIFVSQRFRRIFDEFPFSQSYAEITLI